MAYFSQEDKKKVAPAIKAVFKKYGVKGSIGVSNHSTLYVTIKEGTLDLIGAAQKYNDEAAKRRGVTSHKIDSGYLQVNQYNAAENAKEVGEHKVAKFYEELLEAMCSSGWYDKSDIQTDYFNTAYYISINVGKWNNSYKFIS